MKHLCVLILFSLINGNLLAQDLIIMRSGQEIEAKVLEIGEEVKYKKKSNIEGPTYSVDRDFVFMIKYENGEKDVFSIEKPDSPDPKPVIDKHAGLKSKGFTNITSFTFGIGSGSVGNDFSYGMRMVNGYLVNPHFSIGLGAGIDKYKEILLMPLYVDLRANILKGKVSPYVAFDVGYSIDVLLAGKRNGLQRISGGVLVNPEVGVKIFVSQSTSLVFGVGYRFQQYVLNRSSAQPEQLGHLADMKIGLTF